jgi:hypothetical protein
LPLPPQKPSLSVCLGCKKRLHGTAFDFYCPTF